MMKKLLLCSALLASFSVMNAQNWAEAPYDYDDQTPVNVELPSLFGETQGNLSLIGYYKTNVAPSGVGVQSPTVYEAAIHITDAMAADLQAKQAKLTHIRVALFGVNSIDQKVWIRKSLTEDPVYVQDCKFEEAGVFNTIELNTPYVLDGKGFYIGYSLNQNVANAEADKFPIGVHPSTRNKEGVYMKFGDSPFESYYSQKFGVLAIQGVCEGNFEGIDAGIRSVGIGYCERNGETNIDVSFRNYGETIVRNLDLECTIDGKTTSLGTIDTGFFPGKQSQDFSIKVKAPETEGEKTIKLSIVKVNGQTDDNASNNSAEGTLYVVTQKAKRRTVIEEVTSVKCGWCPRGIVGLRLLRERMPDDAIGIAVHSDGMGKDPYTVYTYDKLARRAKGFPTCFVNRIYECDPYVGTAGHNFGIADDVKKQNDMSALADVNVSAVVSDDKATIDITSETIFRASMKDCSSFKVAYVLVQDGLKARQSNYFSRQTGKWPSEFDEFVNAPGSYNCTLDDIARDIQECNGIVGSLEGEATADVAKTHKFTMDIDRLGKDVNSKININKSRIVVLLLDKKGQVMNANQVALSDGTGIENTIEDALAPAVSVEYGILNIEGEGAMEVEVFTTAGVKVAGEQFVDNTSIALNGLKGVYMVRINNGNDVVVKKVAF